MSEPNSSDMPLNVGDKVTLKIGRGIGTHEVEITHVGYRWVKVKDELGRIFSMNKYEVGRSSMAGQSGRSQRRSRSRPASKSLRRRRSPLRRVASQVIEGDHPLQVGKAITLIG
jgi:hypothetical protein